jgi:hypothetical protein
MYSMILPVGNAKLFVDQVTSSILPPGAGWPDWANFRLFGRFLFLAVFLITEVVIFFLSDALILTKMGWAIHTLSYFYTNSSGHPVQEYILQTVSVVIFLPKV